MPLMPTVTMTVIKYPVPERVKPSFVIFDIRALWRSAPSVRVPGCQNYKWRLNPVWHRMLYGCTYIWCSGRQRVKIRQELDNPLSPIQNINNHCPSPVFPLKLFLRPWSHWQGVGRRRICRHPCWAWKTVCGFVPWPPPPSPASNKTSYY